MNYLDLRDLRDKVESDKRPPERRAGPDDDMAHVRHDAYEDDDMAIPTVRYNGFEDDDDPPPPSAPRPGDIELPQEGEIVRCRVQAVKKYGAFLDLHEHAKTLLHVKDMNRGFVPDAGEFYNVGDEVTVQIVGIDRGRETPEVRVQIAEDV
jgi:polyribonucleotide nucleotidyltransferase